ncbi:rhomboid family intramembrane serine protease [Mangrovimonas sp. AS39]|uniref:rhomboid family intramembrane serine protease n=1 Tax=Mangrovimonas futianensis TaxID=2895523 RepID=UPI001E4F65A9|nr:rhomboid family intramembrane serine protease [Mangrovimonas futianensis]MCF1190661.1 rhomboid family intramembrane serine protease [Mangrovimonas futianensis]MCF1194358.1 rhomboid family intramembrane serine protease [Mangrovimonas futianensis]
MKEDSFQFSNGVVVYPLLFVLSIWLVFWAEVRFGFNFTRLGIYPLAVKGIPGIALSPLIHSGLTHLLHNSLPLLILSAALFYFYRPIAWKVIIFGILLSGLMTWLIGRPSYHIGASGLIYVLVSFTFFKGIFAKHYRLIALSLMVVFLYGGMVWYTFPIKDEISWEGHLSGFLVGLFFALVFRKQIAKPKKYEWEKDDFNEEDDPFLKHFDADGNFIEQLPEEVDLEEDTQDSIVYNYIYKKKDDDD